jgi:ATP-dependent RNA helicase DeaD
MSTFEELDLSPELVEALAADGLESPTAIQRDLVPVVRRGNDVVAVAGPGSGVMVAYAAPLLERIAPEGDGPAILILAPTPERMSGLADSLGRLGAITGHRVAGLDGLWVLPERAHVLVGTPELVHARVRRGQLSLSTLKALVVDGANAMVRAGTLDTVGTLVDGVSPETQRIVVAQPSLPEIEAFADAHLRRSVHVPPQAAGGPRSDSPHRGDLSVVEITEPREIGAVEAVAHLLTEARHVVVYVRSEDAAADLGDFLTVRGFAAGRPGEPDFPVWLAVSGLEARAAIEADGADDVVALSVDVPGDVDLLDQRHGGGLGGTVLALPRELPHLKAVAREGGYGISMVELPSSRPDGGAMAKLRASIEEAIESGDVEAYQLLLEPLFRKHGASAVAAAAVALLRSRKPAATEPARTTESGAAAPAAFVRLFISVGKKDNVRPGDLVGAITGEAQIQADQVGRIDLRDTFSLVEVEGSVAEKVIRGLNGTSIRGRAARVDYHREDRRAGTGQGGGFSRGRDDRGGRGGPGGRPGGGSSRGRDDRGGRTGGPRGSGDDRRGGGGPPRGRRPDRD